MGVPVSRDAHRRRARDCGNRCPRRCTCPAESAEASTRSSHQCCAEKRSEYVLLRRALVKCRPASASFSCHPYIWTPLNPPPPGAGAGLRGRKQVVHRRPISAFTFPPRFSIAFSVMPSSAAARACVDPSRWTSLKTAHCFSGSARTTFLSASSISCSRARSSAASARPTNADSNDSGSGVGRSPRRSPAENRTPCLAICWQPLGALCGGQLSDAS